MSQNRKTLKLVSFAQVLVALLAIGLGIYLFVADPTLGWSEAYGLELGMLRIALGIILVLLGVLVFLSAAQGIKGANRPRNLGNHLPVTLLGAVLAVAEAALMAGAGDTLLIIVAALVIVVNVAAVVFDLKVKGEIDH